MTSMPPDMEPPALKPLVFSKLKGLSSAGTVSSAHLSSPIVSLACHQPPTHSSLNSSSQLSGINRMMNGMNHAAASSPSSSAFDLKLASSISSSSLISHIPLIDQSSGSMNTTLKRKIPATPNRQIAECHPVKYHASGTLSTPTRSTSDGTSATAAMEPESVMTTLTAAAPNSISKATESFRSFASALSSKNPSRDTTPRSQRFFEFYDSRRKKPVLLRSPQPPPARKDTAAIRQQLANSLGDQADLYWAAFRKWMVEGLSLATFDTSVSALLSPDCVTLHNKFILSILYNVHYNFEPPQHQILDEFRPTEEAIIAHKKRLEIATMVSERKGPLYKSEIPTLDSSCKNNIFALKNQPKLPKPCLLPFIPPPLPVELTPELQGKIMSLQTCKDRGTLPTRDLLRSRMDVIGAMNGVGVQDECVLFMEHALSTYLKDVISTVQSHIRLTDSELSFTQPCASTWPLSSHTRAGSDSIPQQRGTRSLGSFVPDRPASQLPKSSFPLLCDGMGNSSVSRTNGKPAQVPLPPQPLPKSHPSGHYPHDGISADAMVFVAGIVPSVFSRSPNSVDTVEKMGWTVHEYAGDDQCHETC